jgi:hypothetical protein
MIDYNVKRMSLEFAKEIKIKPEVIYTLPRHSHSWNGRPKAPATRAT